MRVRSVIAATAALGLTLSGLLSVPEAQAGQTTFTITASPDHVHLKDSFTVTGSNAPCASGTYTVTFTYTNHAGDPATLSATGNLDGASGFSQVIVVPEAATPDQPASVQATVSCASVPGAQTAALQPPPTSNTVTITITVATGVLSTNKTKGKAGTVVHVSGTNCLGDDVVVAFGNNSGADDVTVTLLADDTFSGNYTIPNVPAGSYFFAAACPGTDYNDRAFTVLATPGASPTPLPSVSPTGIRRPVNFTG